MIKQLLYIIIFVGISSDVFAQQEQLYTMFLYNKQIFNPGYVGNEGVANMSILLRDQWNGFEGAPKSQLISFATPMLDNKIGLGFNLVNHTIGIEKKITMEAMYAYRINLASGSLGLGIQVSWRNYTVDFSDPRLVATQNIDLDPSIPVQSFSKNIYNFGVGAYFSSNVYYIGIALPRMAKANLDFDSNEEFSEEVYHLNIMGGGAFAINKKLTIRPQFLFKYLKDTPYDIDFNLGLSYLEKYTTSITYRHGGEKADIGESLDLIFSIQTSPNVMIAVAYDITLSKIRSYQNGSLELMLNYKFKKRKVQEEIINPRYF